MEYSQLYYQQQLTQLTINLRALITELTTLAERHVEKCNEISEMVEARIRKCPPQHKLYVVYLMDSICKNVGNPYNLIFGHKLFKIFTETYSLVTDTPTRQHLINLFKTWTVGKTTGGSELFPEAILQKIESFIILATALSGSESPDYYLKEGRSLLQFIISLNKNVEPFSDETLEASERRRNQLVAIINEICDTIIAEMRDGVDFKKCSNELAEVRKELQQIQVEQEIFLNKQKGKLSVEGIKKSKENEIQDRRNKLESYLEQNKIIPGGLNYAYFTNITEAIGKNDELVELVNNWGKVPVISNKPVREVAEVVKENAFGFRFDLEEPEDVEESETLSKSPEPHTPSVLISVKVSSPVAGLQDISPSVSFSDTDYIPESAPSTSPSTLSTLPSLPPSLPLRPKIAAFQELEIVSDEEYTPQFSQDNFDEFGDDESDYDPTFEALPAQEYQIPPRSILKRRSGDEVIETVVKKRVRFNV